MIRGSSYPLWGLDGSAKGRCPKPTTEKASTVARQPYFAPQFQYAKEALRLPETGNPVRLPVEGRTYPSRTTSFPSWGGISCASCGPDPLKSEAKSALKVPAPDLLRWRSVASQTNGNVTRTNQDSQTSRTIQIITARIITPNQAMNKTPSGFGQRIHHLSLLR
jgi:hypothetical protein